MKKITFTIIAVAAMALIAFWMISGYNQMVAQEENVANAWGQVENEYQRRADFVPQLVGTVQGAASHENSTLTGVMEARAKATQITIDPSHITPEQMAAYQAAQGELSQAMGRLMVVAEAYPELKANENFLIMQSQLEGIQNRCTVARAAFNEQARIFNQLVRSFPNNILAGFFGFEKKPYFEADEASKANPVVQF